MNELQGRVRYVRDGRSLISGRTYNELARLLRNLSSETIQIGIGPNGGLKLEVGSFGASASGSASAQPASYSGPFALARSASGVNVSAGRVIAGVTTVRVPATALTGSGYVLLTVTYSGSYFCALSFANSLPAQTSSAVVYVLGRVASSTEVVQWQYGDIYVAGRVV